MSRIRYLEPNTLDSHKINEYECEFRIPIYVHPGSFLIFRIAAVDMKPPEANPNFQQLLAAQVPWLFSNESGKKLGAVFSSRTGKIVSEDEILKGWTIHTVGSPCLLYTSDAADE